MSDETHFDPFSKMTQLGNLFTPQASILALREFLKAWPDMVERDPPSIAICEDLTLAGGADPVQARIYLPHGTEKDSFGPGLVYYHGGGFMVGTLDTHDRLLRRLAAVSGIRIVSVDYRLAPEHAFPSAIEDALASFNAILGGALNDYGFDLEALAVGGDSAGGNLAASVAREHRTVIKFQLLIYPVLQLVELKKPNPRWKDGPLLSRMLLQEIVTDYVKGADPMDPRVSPLMAETFEGLPSCYFLAADLDPLFEEGQVYCSKLEASGIRVKRRVFKNTPHGFLNFTRMVPGAVKAIEEAGQALREGLS